MALQSDSDISTPSDANVYTKSSWVSESRVIGKPPVSTTGTPLESKNLVPSGKENLPDESGIVRQVTFSNTSYQIKRLTPF